MLIFFINKFENIDKKLEFKFLLTNKFNQFIILVIQNFLCYFLNLTI